MAEIGETREIRFDKFCKTCENKDTAEKDKPCCNCLDHPVKPNGEKPLYYKPKDE